MAKLQSYFEKLISNIEPSRDHKQDAITAHSNLIEHLKGDDSKISKYILDSHLYGSYKRNTAILSINDVDICILTNFTPEEPGHSPQKILRMLKSDISKYYSEVEGYDENNTEYSRKSILVNNALPDKENSKLTLDIIPAIQIDDTDKYLVPDREMLKWVDTNVNGHGDATTNTNKENDFKFVPFVKIFKHWKKYHISCKHPKGFWLESMLLEEGIFRYENSYADTFEQVLQNIIDKYSSYQKVPDIHDPGLNGEYLKTNMSDEQFKAFIALIKKQKVQSTKAIVSDKAKAIPLWQKIFGVEYFHESIESEMFEEKSIRMSEEIDTEIFITDNFKIDESINIYKIVVECKYNPQNGITKFIKSNEPVNKNIKINFSVKPVNVPSGTTYKWKVTNNGVEAKDENCLRGNQISNYTKGNSNSETTSYTGIHYVECYAINNETVIAFDRFRVNIK